MQDVHGKRVAGASTTQEQRGGRGPSKTPRQALLSLPRAMEMHPTAHG